MPPLKTLSNVPFPVEVPTASGKLEVRCLVRRAPRARRISLRLGYEGEALLSLPPRCQLEDGLRFLRSQGEWLTRNIDQARQRETLLPFLRRRGCVSASGHGVRLHLGTSRADAFYVYSASERELVLKLDPEERETSAATLLRMFAGEVLPPRARLLAERHGVRFKRVSVRDQSSRWGSCSSSGTLSLNWRLVLLPPVLQDHILLHELAHLTEMNHSRRFHALLRRYDPQTDAHEAALTGEWAHLMHMGRGTTG